MSTEELLDSIIDRARNFSGKYPVHPFTKLLQLDAINEFRVRLGKQKFEEHELPH